MHVLDRKTLQSAGLDRKPTDVPKLNLEYRKFLDVWLGELPKLRETCNELVKWLVRTYLVVVLK